jgi:hypothetical protein
LKSVIAFAIFCAVLSGSAFAADKANLPSTPPAQSGAEAAPAALAVSVASASVAIAPLANTASPTEPAAPPAPAAVVPVTPARAEVRHNFFDLKNSAGLAALAAGLTADALSTQKGLGLPGFHEMNPIARPFVQNRAGAAAYSAASFALMGSSMYLAHKTNHHKLERVLPFAIAGWEGFLAVRNYHLISSSTRR